MKKKVLSFVLCFAMLLTLAPMTALAATPEEANSEATLKAAFDKLEDSSVNEISIKLTGSFSTEAFDGSKFTVKSGKKVTLDLNGYTITSTAAGLASGNDQLFEIKFGGEMVLEDSSANKTGSITIKSNTNNGWGPCCSVFSVNGKLTVNGGTIENLGGTDMAYAIDVLQNSQPTYVPTLIVNDGSIRSTYIGIRAFANNGGELKISVNDGSVYGRVRGIWVHQPGGKPTDSTVIEVSGGNVAADTGAAIGVDMFPASDSTPAAVAISINGGTLQNNSDTTGTIFICNWDDATPSTQPVQATISEDATLYNAGSAGNIQEARPAYSGNPEFTVESGATFSAQPDTALLVPIPGATTNQYPVVNIVTTPPGTANTETNVVTAPPAPRAKYIGNGQFATENVKTAPTAVYVDGVEVAFEGDENGFFLNLAGMNPGRHKLTVVWNSRTLNTWFDYTGDFQVMVPDSIVVDPPKTGDCLNVMGIVLVGLSALAMMGLALRKREN